MAGKGRKRKRRPGNKQRRNRPQIGVPTQWTNAPEGEIVNVGGLPIVRRGNQIGLLDTGKA